VLLAGEQAIAVHAPAPDDQLLAAELARLARRLDAARGEHRRLIDLYQAGLIDIPELRRRAAGITARQHELEHKRTSLAAERAYLARGNRLRHGVERFAARIAAVIDQLNPVQRQDLLRLLIEDVQVTGWHVKIRLRIPLDDPPDADPAHRPAPAPGTAPASRGTLPVSTEDRLRSLHGHPVVQPPAAPRRIGGQEAPQPVPFLICQIMAIQSIKHRTDLHPSGTKIHGTRPNGQPRRLGRPSNQLRKRCATAWRDARDEIGGGLGFARVAAVVPGGGI
jgi:hypothetical protein